MLATVRIISSRESQAGSLGWLAAILPVAAPSTGLRPITPRVSSAASRMGTPPPPRPRLSVHEVTTAAQGTHFAWTCIVAALPILQRMRTATHSPLEPTPRILRSAVAGRCRPTSRYRLNISLDHHNVVVHE